MAHVSAVKVLATKSGILDAAKQILQTQGYSGLTTRNVAAKAGVPLSQIQYHFGSKEGMLLALFEFMNTQLLDRQDAMFNEQSLTLSQQWDLACDYLDADIASGYVRVLQELMAAGWSNPGIGKVVCEGILSWNKLLTDLAEKALQSFGTLGPFTPQDLAALVGSAFIGAESRLLLGLEDQGVSLRHSLRRFGDIIRIFEDQANRGKY